MDSRRGRLEEEGDRKLLVLEEEGDRKRKGGKDCKIFILL